MGDKFDPYREGLVIERTTVWPAEMCPGDADERGRLSDLLHAHAEQAAELKYVRLHAGFCRRITVTEEDLKRLQPDHPADSAESPEDAPGDASPNP